VSHWFTTAVFLVLVFGFLAWRFLGSRTWKQLQLRKAAAMAAAGRTDDMLRYLRRNINPGDLGDPVTNALVYFYMKAGRFDDAEKIILGAMKRGGETALALAQMGYVAGGRKEYAESEVYYRKAMDLDESLKPTMNVNIAGMLIETGQRLDEAEKLLFEAMELREGAGRSGIHANLAMLYMKLKRPVDARVHAMTAYELIPSGSSLLNVSRANVLALASRACAMQGDGEEASKLASKALKLVRNLPGTEELVSTLEKMVAGVKEHGNDR